MGWKHVASMVVINFALGLVNLLIKKSLDQGLNHLVIVTYRQAISAALLLPIACFWERKSRSELTPQILCHLFFSALIGITLSQYLFLIGLDLTSATFSCAFLNMVPVNTFLLSLPLGLEKVNMKSKSGRAKVLGAVLCLFGALLLTMYRGIPLAKSHSSATDQIVISAKKTKSWVLGSVLLGGGSLLWSSWFLVQARIGQKYPFQYSSTAILSFFSSIQSAILTLAIHRNISMWVLKGTWEIISVTYAGMVGSGLCYVGMSWCIKQKGPVFTAAFTPFTQIFVAFFDFSIFNEQIYLGSVVGSVLVVLGMYILLWGKSKEAHECPLKQNQAAEEGEEFRQVSHVLPVTVNSR